MRITTGQDAIKLRQRTMDVLRNKYYSLYMNNYKWKELDYQQNDYFFRKMWSEGKISAFMKKHFEGYEALCFTPFAPIQYNNYNFPINVNLINERGVKFIPTRAMNVDEDVVIGWAQRNLKSIYSFVDYWCDRICNIEMLLNIQTIVHKMPFLVGVTEENKDRIKEFMKELLGDNPVIFCDMDEINLFKALSSGAPYIMDKLYQMKQNYENELLTFLGIDNLGGSEKKEHLITSEVDSNNMLIKDHADTFVDILREFAERIKKVFGLTITLECKSETYLMMSMQKEDSSDKIENENKEEN